MEAGCEVVVALFLGLDAVVEVLHIGWDIAAGHEPEREGGEEGGSKRRHFEIESESEV